MLSARTYQNSLIYNKIQNLKKIDLNKNLKTAEIQTDPKVKKQPKIDFPNIKRPRRKQINKELLSGPSTFCAHTD